MGWQAYADYHEIMDMVQGPAPCGCGGQSLAALKYATHHAWLPAAQQERLTATACTHAGAVTAASRGGAQTTPRVLPGLGGQQSLHGLGESGSETPLAACAGAVPGAGPGSGAALPQSLNARPCATGDRCAAPAAPCLSRTSCSLGGLWQLSWPASAAVACLCRCRWWQWFCEPHAVACCGRLLPSARECSAGSLQASTSGSAAPCRRRAARRLKPCSAFQRCVPACRSSTPLWPLPAWLHVLLHCRSVCPSSGAEPPCVQFQGLSQPAACATGLCCTGRQVHTGG